MDNTSSTHNKVREYYGHLARTSQSCCELQNKLYPIETIKALPTEIVNFTAGSGNPLRLAQLQTGETVLDLGSGGGLDCFLAAQQVGENGFVFGVDMTPEMLARARESAQNLRFKNVEFREGFLEALPIDDNSIDIVISNCVINLSPDKSKVIQEIARVLKLGGRMIVSDIVTNSQLPEEGRKIDDDWCGCASGAMTVKEYIERLEKAGLMNITIQPDLESAPLVNEPDAEQVSEGETTERRLQILKDWGQCERIIYLPHMISAHKPG